MLRATVTGSVWATRRVDALPSGALLEVRTDDGACLIAFDVLGSGVGERVLVATGSVASGYFGDAHPPLDALIIGSLDEPNGEEQRHRAALLPAAARPGPAVGGVPRDAAAGARLSADRGRPRAHRRGRAGPGDRAHHRPRAQVGARGRARHPLRRAPVRGAG